MPLMYFTFVKYCSGFQSRATVLGNIPEKWILAPGKGCLATFNRLMSNLMTLPGWLFTFLSFPMKSFWPAWRITWSGAYPVAPRSMALRSWSLAPGFQYTWMLSRSPQTLPQASSRPLPWDNVKTSTLAMLKNQNEKWTCRADIYNLIRPIGMCGVYISKRPRQPISC